MTAAEIAALVTAAVSLMGAAAAWLHSRTTRAMVTSATRTTRPVPNGQHRSTTER